MFDINADLTGKETENIAIIIRQILFDVTIHQSHNNTDTPGHCITLIDSTNRTDDVILFSLFYSVHTNTINYYLPMRFFLY